MTIDDSDLKLVERVQRGERAAFDILVLRYQHKVLKLIMRYVHDASEAEDIAQEAFVKAFRALPSFRGDSAFYTWLYRIATNLAVNQARDSKHERAARNVYLDVPDEETGAMPEVADETPSVEARLLQTERMAAIRQHVMALPERQRIAVLMHKYQGMDYRQIGEVLKLSESATKSLLFRAYQTLREKLKEFV